MICICNECPENCQTFFIAWHPGFCLIFNPSDSLEYHTVIDRQKRGECSAQFLQQSSFFTCRILFKGKPNQKTNAIVKRGPLLLNYSLQYNLKVSSHRPSAIIWQSSHGTLIYRRLSQNFDV